MVFAVRILTGFSTLPKWLGTEIDGVISLQGDKRQSVLLSIALLSIGVNISTIMFIRYAELPTESHFFLL